MKRKEAIKTLMMASGAAITLPSWALSWRPENVPLDHNVFTDYEISTISSIVDTIIPSNGTIGALSVGVDTFLIGLISECYEEEFRGEIRAELFNLDSKAKENEGASFADCSESTRKRMLLELERSSIEKEQEFFDFMKDQTIRGFETSEEVLVNYHGYVMMPGFYDGNVDVEV